MKKSLALLLLFILAVNLSGCGSGSNPGNTATNTAVPEETKEAAAAQATADAAKASPSEPEVIFRYSEVNGPDNIMARVGYKFAEYVDELSDGRIKIEVFPNAVLGPEKASLNTLKEGGGAIDMYRANTNALTGFGFKKLNLFGLPYIFKSREGMWKVLEDKDLGQAFLSEGTEIGAGMQGLFYTDEGKRNLFFTQKVNGLEDIKNKKIRVPESVLMMDTISALGARPIPMPYEELYRALQNGVVNGAENPLTAYYTNKFYEVAPYYFLSGITYSPGIVLMAEEKWNAISEEDKKILLTAGQMASEWNRKEITKDEEDLREKLKEEGVTFIEMTPEERATAEKEEEIVQTSFATGLQNLLNEILEVQKQE